MCYDMRWHSISLFMANPSQVDSLLRRLRIDMPQTDEFEGTPFALAFSGISEGVAMLLRVNLEMKAIWRTHDSGYETWRLDQPSSLLDVPPLPEEYVIGPHVASQLPPFADSFLPGSLTDQDADFIDKDWPYRTSSSAATFRWCLANFPSACIRIRGETYPIAWITTSVDGSLENLNVLPESVFSPSRRILIPPQISPSRLRQGGYQRSCLETIKIEI